MRVTVRGESALQALEARDPGTIAAAIQAATQDFDGADLWIESVHLELRSPIDRESAGQRPDAVGEVIRLVNELATNDDALREWTLSKLDKLPNLPPDLADVDPGKLSVEQMRIFLAEAEATVLSKLSSVEAA